MQEIVISTLNDGDEKRECSGNDHTDSSHNNSIEQDSDEACGIQFVNPIKVIDNLNREKLFDVNTSDAGPQPLQQKKANQMSFLESESKTDHSLSTTESEVDTEQKQVNKKQH